MLFELRLYTNIDNVTPTQLYRYHYRYRLILMSSLEAYTNIRIWHYSAWPRKMKLISPFLTTPFRIAGADGSVSELPLAAPRALRYVPDGPAAQPSVHCLLAAGWVLTEGQLRDGEREEKGERD